LAIKNWSYTGLTSQGACHQLGYSWLANPIKMQSNRWHADFNAAVCFFNPFK